MVNNIPLTKKDLESVLSNILKDVPTKKDVFEMVIQSSEAVISGVEKMIDGLRDETKMGFSELKSGHRDLQRQVSDLKTDTPTKKEFEELRSKVYGHHPLN